ncbi:PREDICTED: uncharacterized protein LOC105567213 [Vollenhovia emeryi]|uniref:uncharacterized protein LOC105567213 n=1 Tax=Vollenhovia emeryi TaxID=411798 RepID=UPI0005F4A711|nr:PREDICTED: uncharacterized protein LOC105567213 [Vollenhovia emeryi]
MLLDVTFAFMCGVTLFHFARQEVSICILDALNTTLQKYNTVTVLKLTSCQINAYGILQIAQTLTELECLDDLNLDDNPNVQENYYLLCAPTRNLRYLSLRMCKLSDNGIQRIANELTYRDPPNDPKLIALNVADNDITDIGAEYIAAMLRTNRSRIVAKTLLGIVTFDPSPRESSFNENVPEH